MSVDCTSARTWLSAFRDDEAMPDRAARAHIDACDACLAWESHLDGLTRRLTVRTAGTVDFTGPALAAWSRRAAGGAATQTRIARGILSLAGVAGVALAAATAFGLINPAGGHSVRDLVAMETALAVGFLLGAWRPDRYTRGLWPVASVAGVLTLMSSASDVAGTQTDLVREAAHLPVLLGLLGLFVILDGMGATIPRRRR